MIHDLFSRSSSSLTSAVSNACSHCHSLLEVGYPRSKNWTLGEGPVFFEPIFFQLLQPQTPRLAHCVPNIYIYIYIYIYSYTFIYIYVYIHIYRKNSRSRSMDTCVKSPICPMKLFVALLRFHARLCQCLSSPNRVRLATQPCQGHRPLLQKVHDFRLSHGWNEIDSQDGLSLKAQVHRRANRQHMTLKSVEIMHIPLSHRHSLLSCSVSSPL